MAQALQSEAEAGRDHWGPHSNHARLTARRAPGSDCASPVLEGHPPESERGNVLLDRLFGAEIIWSGDRRAEKVADDVEGDASRGKVHRIPFGGSSPASAEAYVSAGQELLEQVSDVRHVVVAVGSGGTMAGLVTALGAHRVLGVDSGAVPDARSTVHDLIAGMRADTGIVADSLRIDGSAGR